jgi:AcrR family transcriptional regulator
MDVPEKMGSARERMLEVAYELFSERGFEGVSLADIATELGLTKQAVIYHFKTKRALYGEVLTALAGRYEQLPLAVKHLSENSDEQWRRLMAAIWMHTSDRNADAALIARELLDNRGRAVTARQWYLRNFLDLCVEIYGSTTKGGAQPLPMQRLEVYRELGAVSYLAISETTLTAIWGGTAVADMKKVERDLFAI